VVSKKTIWLVSLIGGNTLDLEPIIMQAYDEFHMYHKF